MASEQNQGSCAVRLKPVFWCESPTRPDPRPRQIAKFAGAVDTTVRLTTTAAQATGQGSDRLIGIENVTTARRGSSSQIVGYRHALGAHLALTLWGPTC